METDCICGLIDTQVCSVLDVSNWQHFFFTKKVKNRREVKGKWRVFLLILQLFLWDWCLQCPSDLQLSFTLYRRDWKNLSEEKQSCSLCFEDPTISSCTGRIWLADGSFYIRRSLPKARLWMRSVGALHAAGMAMPKVWSKLATSLWHSWWKKYRRQRAANTAARFWKCWRERKLSSCSHVLRWWKIRTETRANGHCSATSIRPWSPRLF